MTAFREQSSIITPLDAEAVFDTSPLILLDKLGYLSALRELRGSIVIPETVANELLLQPGKPASHVPDLDWVSTLRPSEVTLRRVLEGPPVLDAKEAEAIALAIDNRALLVIDELKGRERARHLGVSLSGTIGEILLLRESGLSAAYSKRSPEEDLQLLLDAGMRISETLRIGVLQQLDDMK